MLSRDTHYNYRRPYRDPVVDFLIRKRVRDEQGGRTGDGVGQVTDVGKGRQASDRPVSVSDTRDSTSLTTSKRVGLTRSGTSSGHAPLSFFPLSMLPYPFPVPSLGASLRKTLRPSTSGHLRIMSLPRRLSETLRGTVPHV